MSRGRIGRWMEDFRALFQYYLGGGSSKMSSCCNCSNSRECDYDAPVSGNETVHCLPAVNYLWDDIR